MGNRFVAAGAGDVAAGDSLRLVERPLPQWTVARVFALLIGVFFLREKLDLGKVISTTLTLLGVALLRLAK